MAENRGVAYMGTGKVEVQNIDFPGFEVKDGPGVNPDNVGRQLPHVFAPLPFFIHLVGIGPYLCRLYGESPAFFACDLQRRCDTLVVMRRQSGAVRRDVAVHAHRAVEVELRADFLRPPRKERIGHVDIGDADGGARAEKLAHLAVLHFPQGLGASGLFSARERCGDVVAPILYLLTPGERQPQFFPAEEFVELMRLPGDIQRGTCEMGIHELIA